MRKNRKAVARRVTLREESLAENKELGLEAMQEQMDVIFAVLHEHGINSRLWMQEYLEAAERNGGKGANRSRKISSVELNC